MNVTVFEAINITKKYRNTLALNQVSMSVMQGDIYGFWKCQEMCSRETPKI